MCEVDRHEHGEHPGKVGVRVARALLFGFGVVILWMADSGWLNWGVWDQPAPLVVGAFPLLLWICTWQVFRLARYQATPVPLRSRARSALAGAAAVATVASLLWILIPLLAPTPNHYPERYVDSQARILPEALGLCFFGIAGTLLLPSRIYLHEAHDPIRAVLSWASVPLIPLVVFWAPLKYSVTHVGAPSGWGRLVILSLAFGVGWALSARQPKCAATVGDGEVLVARTALRDLPFVTLLVLALVVAMFFVGWLLEGYLRGLYLYPLILVLVSLMSIHWQAPRAGSNVAELGRAVFLSVPLLVVLLAIAAFAVATGAGRTLSQPDLLLVPVPVAATGTLWLAGVMVIAMARIKLPRATSRHPVSPVERKTGADSIRRS